MSCTLHWWPQKLLSLSESHEHNAIEISSFFVAFPALYHTLSTDEPNTERQHFQRPEHLPEQPNVSNLSKDGALLQWPRGWYSRHQSNTSETWVQISSRNRRNAPEGRLNLWYARVFLKASSNNCSLHTFFGILFRRTRVWLLSLVTAASSNLRKIGLRPVDVVPVVIHCVA